MFIAVRTFRRHSDREKEEEYKAVVARRRGKENEKIKKIRRKKKNKKNKKRKIRGRIISEEGRKVRDTMGAGLLMFRGIGNIAGYRFNASFYPVCLYTSTLCNCNNIN